MSSPELSIILRSPDSGWGGALGTGDWRGVVPQGLTITANESGPDVASFTLRRRADAVFPDLLAFSQADVIVGGVLVWGGRVWETPLSSGDEDLVNVAGRGWQYALDDDFLSRCYVMTDLTRYVDQRSKPTAELTPFRAGPQVQAGAGAIMLIYPSGFATVTGDAVGVTIDLGATRAKRAVVTWERVGISDGNTTVYSRATSGESWAGGGGADDASSLLTSAGGTLTHTFSTAFRYHHVFVYRNGGPGTWGADEGVRVTDIKLFGETAYESGNLSVLKASQVFADVLASGSLPLLDASTANIGTTAFSIPELAPQGYQTPRSIMAAANAYEGNLFGVDAERRLFLRERDENPLTEVGSWPGSSFQDASTNSGDGLYSRVIVQGTGPDGSPISEIRYETLIAPAGSLVRTDTGLVTNTSFEVDASGWTAGGVGTIARSTSQAFEGTASLSMTESAGGLVNASTTVTGLSPGRTYELKIAVHRSSSQASDYVISVSTASATLVSQAFVAALEGTWTTHAIQFTVPVTGTVTVLVAADHIGTPAAAVLLYLDAVRISEVTHGIVSRQGFIRTAVLSVEAATTVTGAQELGDIWLRERFNPPMKGSVTVQGWGAARYVNGGDVHPSEFLLRYGQRIRLGHLVDPSTGDQGRDGVIAAVTYAHDTETATLSLDNERGRLETLLSRLAVVAGQVR
jgi:hypothetical protein